MRRFDKNKNIRRANILAEQRYLNEANRHGQGDPHEMADMLKLLPTDDTAKQLTKEIVHEINNNPENFNKENNHTQEFTYTPEDKCLKPYSVEINVLGRTNPRINHAEQHYIEVWITHDGTIPNDLIESVYEIIKHECGHFYMGLKGATACLYHTHKDGIKKYYVDNQELNLHGREIFEQFTRSRPGWQTMDLETIKKRLKERIKYLRGDKNVPGLFNGGVQLKYFLFIMKNYVEPNMYNLAYNGNFRNLLVKLFDDYEQYHDVNFKDGETEGKIFSHEGYSTLMGRDMGIAVTQKLGEDGEGNEYSIMVDSDIHDEDNYKYIKGTSMDEVIQGLKDFLAIPELKKKKEQDRLDTIEKDKQYKLDRIAKRKEEEKKEKTLIPAMMKFLFGKEQSRVMSTLNELGSNLYNGFRHYKGEFAFGKDIEKNLSIDKASNSFRTEITFHNKEVGGIHMTLIGFFKLKKSDDPNGENTVERSYNLKVGRKGKGKVLTFKNTEELIKGLSNLIETIKGDEYLIK